MDQKSLDTGDECYWSTLKEYKNSVNNCTIRDYTGSTVFFVNWLFTTWDSGDKVVGNAIFLAFLR